MKNTVVRQESTAWMKREVELYSLGSTPQQSGCSLIDGAGERPELPQIGTRVVICPDEGTDKFQDLWALTPT